MKERKLDLNWRVIFAAVLILLIAAFILFAIFTPRHAEIDGDTLRFKHLFTSFDVPLGDVASVELLDSLPSLNKVSGIGVFFLSEGTYRVDGYGTCTISLNQSEPPFIAVTDKSGESWLFSLNDQDTTRELYGELADKIPQN